MAESVCGSHRLALNRFNYSYTYSDVPESLKLSEFVFKPFFELSKYPKAVHFGIHLASASANMGRPVRCVISLVDISGTENDKDKEGGCFSQGGDSGATSRKDNMVVLDRTLSSVEDWMVGMQGKIDLDKSVESFKTSRTMLFRYDIMFN